MTGDTALYEIQDHLDLEACWLGPVDGKSGPSASLYAYGEEILRIDCFGGVASHLHINTRQASPFLPRTTARLYFESGTIRQHIERAVFELCRNSAYCIALNQDPRIQRITLDETRLEEAGVWLRERLLDLLDKHVDAGALTSRAGGEQRAI